MCGGRSTFRTSRLIRRVPEVQQRVLHGARGLLRALAVHNIEGRVGDVLRQGPALITSLAAGRAGGVRLAPVALGSGRCDLARTALRGVHDQQQAPARMCQQYH